MIKLLGIRRSLMIGILLAMNLALAGVFAGWVMPMKMDAETQLQMRKNEVSSLQGRIQNIKMELQAMQENLPRYEALRARGFFSGQDRFDISRLLEANKEKSGVMGFSFVIGDLQTLQNTDAATAQRNLVNSRIKIDKVASLLDVGLFDLITVLENDYPSHVRIHSFNLRRAGQIDEAALRNLSQRQTSLITADLTFDWLTLAPLPTVDTSAGLPGAGGFR